MAQNTAVVQRSGHLGAALVCYAPVGFVAAAFGLEDLAVVGALGAAGLAMLPDVDLRLPFVRHRGPTHTVWFALAVAAVGGWVGWTAGIAVGIATAVGLASFAAAVAGLAVGSHVAADALTPMGVRPYAPLSARRVTYDLTRATDPVANLLGLLVGLAVAVGAVGLGRVVAGL